MQNMQIEKVRVIVGIPADETPDQVPVTIHDPDSRRLKYQRAHRDQLAVMNGDSMGEWTAIWLPTTEQWRLVDYLGDFRNKIRIVEAA